MIVRLCMICVALVVPSQLLAVSSKLTMSISDMSASGEDSRFDAYMHH